MRVIGTEQEIDELIFELSEYSMANDCRCFLMETRDGICIGKVDCSQCIEDNIELEAVNDGTS